MTNNLIIALALALLAVAGCGHGDVTVTDGKGNTVKVSGNDGAVNVTDNGNGSSVQVKDGHVEVKSKDGSATYTNKDGVQTYQDDKGEHVQIGGSITEADLGVPFYPGSAEGAGSMKSDTDKGIAVQSIRTTTDDPSKVIDFYVQKLGAPKTKATVGVMSMASWEAGKKKTTVTATKGDKSTNVQVMVEQDK